jgi:hypothetical protein
VPTPIVVSTTPAVGATDVPVADAIQFAFNTPLLPSSVTEATFVLYNDDSSEMIIGQITLSSDHKTITFLPNRTLLENVPYLAAAIGASDNAAGGNIKASDGTDLPDTYQVSFRTRVERYVPLSEVADRDDLIDIAPIREDDPAAEVTGYLSVEETVPAGFATNLDRGLSEIIVCFGEAVLPTGSADALELIINNVLGIDEYYGEGEPRPPDPSGRFLQDCLATGDARQALFTGQPFGAVSFSGECVRWDRDSNSPEFHYNSEIVVRVRSDSIVNATGQMLEEDVYFTFTTEYWPLYTGVQYIRLKLGRAISNLFDDTINRHIHAASVDAVQQAACCFDTEHPYPAVRRYVQACTILSILDEIGLLPALQAGSKRLGDLDIQYSPQDMAKIIAAYRRAEAEKEKALFELRYYRRQSRPMVVVKGQNYAGERRDFRMRTWQGLRARSQPSANTAELRAYKSRLAFDHPTYTISYIGWDEDGNLYEGTTWPWWT